MARVANVVDNGTDKVVIHRLTCDISEAFDSHVDRWTVENDISRASAIRKFCADGFGYVPSDTSELVLVKRSLAHQIAGQRRKETSDMTKKKASELDLLKAKLASGEISTEDLVKMLLG